MKTKLLLVAALVSFSQALNAQSISFTSTLTEAQIGTTITVNYEYTVPSAGNIYCAINLYNNYTWSSMVADGVLSPAPAGTNVSGSFDFTIPPGTTQTEDLTSPYNYKLVIELSDSGWNWIAGAYPSTEINLTNSSLGTEDFNQLNMVNVYYYNSRIHIRGLESIDKYELNIFDLFGREVQSNIKDNTIVNLPSSIYIVNLKVDGKGIKTTKILIN